MSTARAKDSPEKKLDRMTGEAQMSLTSLDSSHLFGDN